MIFDFTLIEISLAFISLIALFFSFHQIRLRRADVKSLKAALAREAAVQEPVELPVVEENIVVTSSKAAIEEMLQAIAAGANVLEEAAKNGFSEDEARVAMASYDI
jgi:hypothetical protein